MTTSSRPASSSETLYQIQSQDFDRLTVTKYLTAEQRENILAQKVTINAVRNLSSLVNNPYGMPTLLYNKSFPKNFISIPITALRARFAEQISDDQFTTLCLLYEVADQLILHPKYIRTFVSSNGRSLETYPINRLIPRILQQDTKPATPPHIPEHLKKYQDVDDEKVVNPIRNFFEMDHALRSKYPKETDRILQTYFGFTDRELQEFKTRLLSVHPSEHYFYMFPIPPGPVRNWSPMYARISEVLRQRYPVSSTPEPLVKTSLQQFEPRRVLVVPSFSMLKLFKTIRYGEHASLQIPVLGTITKTTIEFFRTFQQTVFNIGIEGAELPDEADKIKTGGQGAFTAHDDYHAERYSWILNNEKQALVHVNSVLEIALKIKPSDPNNSRIKKIKWELTDGELHNSVQRRHKFGAIFPQLALWNEDSKRLVITDMVFRKSVWNGFNLSRKDLYPREQSLYDQVVAARQRMVEQLAEHQFTDPITPEQYEKIKKYSSSRRIITY